MECRRGRNLAHRERFRSYDIEDSAMIRRWPDEGEAIAADELEPFSNQPPTAAPIVREGK
jgi:hypothetical protein